MEKIDIDLHVHFAGLGDALHFALAPLIFIGEKLMAKIDDYIAAQQTFNATLGTAVDALTASSAATATSVSEIANDVKNLDDQISALVAGGGLTQAQSDALDKIQADNAAILGKAQSLVTSSQATADAAAAVDALTPPVVPAAKA